VEKNKHRKRHLHIPNDGRKMEQQEPFAMLTSIATGFLLWEESLTISREGEEPFLPRAHLGPIGHTAGAPALSVMVRNTKNNCMSQQIVVTA
jgi:hypothetical protein